MPPAPTKQIEKFFRAHLRLSHLRTLSAMASLGQVKKVAAAFNVTQSAVSKQLAEIEAGIGETLLRRSGNALVFTSVGAKMAARASDILGQLDHLRLELDSLSAGLSGRIRVGSVTTVNSSLLPRAICLLQQRTRNMDFALEESTADRLLQHLREGSLDVVVCRMWHPIHMPNVSQSVLMNESLVVVCSARHPLAKRARLTWKEAVRYPWIVPNAGSPAFNALETLVAHQGHVLPAGRVESISLTLNFALYEMEQYVGLLPRNQAERMQDRGELHVLPLDTENLLSETRMFWRSEDEEQTTNLMLTCLREAAAAQAAQPSS